MAKEEGVRLDEKQLSLNSFILYFEDAYKTLSLDEVRRNNKEGWKRNSHNAFNVGHTQSAYWIYINLENTSHNRYQKLLEINYSHVDYIDVYEVVADSMISHIRLGDKYPFYQRPIVHHNFLIPLTWLEQENKSLYFRIETKGTMQLPLMLWDKQAFDIYDMDVNIVIGIYYGVLLVVMIYNLLLFFTIKNPTHLYYVLYALSTLVLMLYINGIGFHYLWPDFNLYHEYILLAVLNFAILFMVLFSKHLLKITTKSHPIISRFLMLGLVICGGLFLSAPLVDYNLMLKAHYLAIIIFFLPFVFIGAYRWRQGLLEARYYTISFVVIMTGASIVVLSRVTIIPSSWITDYAFQISSAIEIIFLSFALAERVNREQKKHKKARTIAFKHERLASIAKAEALEDQMRTNELLKEKVKERTLSLEDANNQLHKLSSTDALTGLNNRQSFDQKFDKEIKRNRRTKHYLSILVIDIDLFKQVNDNYGHSVGDTCIKLVAERIAAETRADIDVAARYGGEEFCVLLPEMAMKEAVDFAETIRKSIYSTELSVDAHRLHLSVSVGVAEMLPDSQISQEDLFIQADKALYQSKEGGRNRVTVYQDD